MDKIWILWWKYSDGSGQGVIRAYEDETRAQEDFELIEYSGETNKDYMLDKVPYIKEKRRNHETSRPNHVT